VKKENNCLKAVEIPAKGGTSSFGGGFVGRARQGILGQNGKECRESSKFWGGGRYRKRAGAVDRRESGGKRGTGKWGVKSGTGEEGSRGDFRERDITSSEIKSEGLAPN